MSVHVIESQDEFCALREEWNELLRSSRSDCVFLTHEWLFGWWKHLAENRSLSILAVRANGRLDGLAPLAVRPPQYSRCTPAVLEFIGSGSIGSDYLDVVARREHEPRVLEALAEYLRGTKSIAQFSQVRVGASLTGEIARYLTREQWTVSEDVINICPYVRIAGLTWESYLATLSSNHRYNFQRRLRRLASDPKFRCVRATDEGEAKRFLDALIDLHRKRWESRQGLSEAFSTAGVVAFHHEFIRLALRNGWLRLWNLFVDNAPVAALYGLSYGGTFSFYQSGFDPAFNKLSVGMVMMGLSIRDAIEEGVSEYDLLHGAEEYKFHWARESREIGRLELYPADSKGLIYKHAIDLNRAARRLARRVLTRP
jgi:CelD/BcsL family acetyltransferase involved in cellulose biosynthesis